MRKYTHAQADNGTNGTNHFDTAVPGPNGVIEESGWMDFYAGLDRVDRVAGGCSLQMRRPKLKKRGP